MASTTISLQLRRNSLIKTPNSIQFFSSSSSSSSSFPQPPPPNAKDETTPSPPSQSQSQPSFTSYFNPFQRAQQPQSPFQRSQTLNPPTKGALFDEIRKNLSESRNRTSAPPPPELQNSWNRTPSRASNVSFQEDPLPASFDEIRKKLSELRNGTSAPPPPGLQNSSIPTPSRASNVSFQEEEESQADEIRKNLSEFRNRTAALPPPGLQNSSILIPTPSRASNVSFQEEESQADPLQPSQQRRQQPQNPPTKAASFDEIQKNLSDMNTGRWQNKRNWSVEEDRALIETLQEVALDTNWKSDKGWRDGYLVRVEELMAMKVPMAGLKANPHIESRWKYLKRKYHALADMRASSGFGWDETTKKIQCDKSVYDEWCKSHKDARGMWGVSFPHFHALGELMGNDRATGSNVEQFSEAIENMGNEKSDSMYSASTEEAEQDCPSVSKSCKRKRSKDSSEKNLIAMFDDVSSKLGSFMDNIDMHLGKLVASESDDMEGKVMDALRQMEGLSGGQVLLAAEILMAEPHKLKVFYHADAELRKEYIYRLLLAKKK